MTNRTVVIDLCFVINTMIKRGAPEAERKLQLRNHVLVFVVREDDRELERCVRFSKRKSSVVAWRNLRMTHGTDYRSICPEELWSMATYTRRMIRIVSYVRVRLRFLPAF